MIQPPNFVSVLILYHNIKNNAIPFCEKLYLSFFSSSFPLFPKSIPDKSSCLALFSSSSCFCFQSSMSPKKRKAPRTQIPAIPQETSAPSGMTSATNTAAISVNKIRSVFKINASDRFFGFIVAQKRRKSQVCGCSAGGRENEKEGRNRKYDGFLLLIPIFALR